MLLFGKNKELNYLKEAEKTVSDILDDNEGLGRNLKLQLMKIQEDIRRKKAANVGDKSAANEAKEICRLLGEVNSDVRNGRHISANLKIGFYNGGKNDGIAEEKGLVLRIAELEDELNKLQNLADNSKGLTSAAFTMIGKNETQNTLIRIDNLFNQINDAASVKEKSIIIECIKERLAAYEKAKEKYAVDDSVMSMYSDKIRELEKEVDASASDYRIGSGFSKVGIDISSGVSAGETYRQKYGTKIDSSSNKDYTHINSGDYGVGKAYSCGEKSDYAKTDGETTSEEIEEYLATNETYGRKLLEKIRKDQDKREEIKRNLTMYLKKRDEEKTDRFDADIERLTTEYNVISANIERFRNEQIKLNQARELLEKVRTERELGEVNEILGAAVSGLDFEKFALELKDTYKRLNRELDDMESYNLVAGSEKLRTRRSGDIGGIRLESGFDANKYDELKESLGVK